MTTQEALDLVNGVLKVVGDKPLSQHPPTETDRQGVKAILHAYATHLREKRPDLRKIEDDRMLPDIVIQKIAAALSGNN